MLDEAYVCSSFWRDRARWAGRTPREGRSGWQWGGLRLGSPAEDGSLCSVPPPPAIVSSDVPAVCVGGGEGRGRGCTSLFCLTLSLTHTHTHTPLLQQTRMLQVRPWVRGSLGRGRPQEGRPAVPTDETICASTQRTAWKDREREEHTTPP